MANGADPILGIEKVLGIFMSAGVAAIIAPHLVVIISGMAGGILGLMSWRQCSIREGLLYIMGMMMLAWLLAGSMAELAALTWPQLDDKRLLTPAALGVGWVGHRWPIVGKWLARIVRASLETALRSPK